MKLQLTLTVEYDPSAATALLETHLRHCLLHHVGRAIDSASAHGLRLTGQHLRWDVAVTRLDPTPEPNGAPNSRSARAPQ